MMPMVESMVTMQMSVLLRFGRHDDVLALPPPPADRPVEVAWWHFARGVAFARTGAVDDAAAERARLHAAIADRAGDGALRRHRAEPARDILTLASTVLDARMAEARGARRGAVALWRSAVAHGDRVPYDEPPIFFYPLRESLGAALLKAGDAAGAEARLPRRPRSLSAQSALAARTA